MRRRLPRLALALGLLAAAAVLLGQGGWIFAKAQLAQVLLARAWAQTEAGAAPGPGVKPWPWADTWPVARLSVPRLGVERIVLAGAHGEALAFGPGHVDGTAAPGTAGNVVLAGHRDTHFRFLLDLAPGDELVLESPGGAVRRYRVERALVVDRRDRRPLAPTAGPALTLITCYPFDAVVPGGPLRYVVRALEEPALRSRPATIARHVRAEAAHPDRQAGLRRP